MPAVISRFALSVACVIAVTTPARAQVSPEDTAAAAALFKEAQAILDTGTTDATIITQACAKFEQSLKLDAQLGTRMNLAACRQKEGRHVDALHLYEESLVEATQTRQTGREAFARKEIQALGRKLVRLKLRVPNEPTDLTIDIAGQAIERERWSQTIVVGPGTVVITARASGRESARIERSASVGEELTIDIPELAVERPAAKRSRKLAYVVGGAGTGLVLTSLILGLHAKSRYDDAKNAGDPDGVSSAQTEADVATGLFVVGAVGIGVGVWLWLRARSDEQVAFVPTATPSSVGVAFMRAF
jgi:hypothetical protein